MAKQATPKSLRILICAHEHPPMGSGIAYLVRNIAQALRNLGHEVQVCSPVGPDVILGGRNLIERTGGVGIVAFWCHVRRYIRAHKKEYDIIWTHNPLFIRKPKVPLFSTVHTTYLQRSATLDAKQTPMVLRVYNAMMRLVERWAYTRMREGRFSVTSALTAHELKALGIEGTLPLIPNGVDTTHFKPAISKARVRSRLGLPSKGTVLLNVGRMMPQKRQQLLIERFKAIRQENDRLVIAGDGPLRREVEEAADEQVILTGRIDQERLLEHYQAADFFVMPSTYEGQPLSLFEAMACGCIPILSPIPIFKTMHEQIGIGMIVDFEQKSASKELKGFMASCGREALSRRLRRIVVDRFGWEKVARQYEKEMKGLYFHG